MILSTYFITVYLSARGLSDYQGRISDYLGHIPLAGFRTPQDESGLGGTDQNPVGRIWAPRGRPEPSGPNASIAETRPAENGRNRDSYGLTGVPTPQRKSTKKARQGNQGSSGHLPVGPCDVQIPLVNVRYRQCTKLLTSDYQGPT